LLFILVKSQEDSEKSKKKKKKDKKMLEGKLETLNLTGPKNDNTLAKISSSSVINETHVYFSEGYESPHSMKASINNDFNKNDPFKKKETSELPESNKEDSEAYEIDVQNLEKKIPKKSHFNLSSHNSAPNNEGGNQLDIQVEINENKVPEKDQS